MSEVVRIEANLEVLVGGTVEEVLRGSHETSPSSASDWPLPLPLPLPLPHEQDVAVAMRHTAGPRLSATLFNHSV